MKSGETPSIKVRPGVVLRELILETRKVTVTDAARALQVTRKYLSELLNAHTGLTADMAFRLSRVFGTTPEIWLMLQLEYELSKVSEKLEGVQFEQIR